jgi:hypothetical protein
VKLGFGTARSVKNAGAALKPFALAISAHVARALQLRLPVLREVVTMSEHEVFSIGVVLQGIREESKQQVADLENVHQRIGQPDGSGAHGSQQATMYASMRDQQRAHDSFVEFCGSVDTQLAKHQELALAALVAVRRIAEIASSIDEIGMSAIMVAINARIESAHLGSTGRHFNVIADELRELTLDVKRSSNDIARISAELMTVIPSIAEHAVGLRQSHKEASQGLAAQLSSVSERQRETLECVEQTVREGGARADRVVAQLHEVVGRLQFQDLIAQRITSITNQEVASAQLLERSLQALNRGTADEPDDFAKQCDEAEYLSQASTAEERAARTTGEPSERGAASGELVFL